MWLTGSYDAELNLVYWTVGNPGPQIDRSVRAGDNLFSDSVVALDAKTGKHLWRFQTGASMAASPMSYAVGGRQFIAVSAGNVLYSFALPE